MNQFVYAFTIGAVFAYVYSKTGKIHYTILMHMLINFLGSVVSLLIFKWSGFLEIAYIDSTDTAAVMQKKDSCNSEVLIRGDCRILTSDDCVADQGLTTWLLCHDVGRQQIHQWSVHPGPLLDFVGVLQMFVWSLSLYNIIEIMVSFFYAKKRSPSRFSPLVSILC